LAVYHSFFETLTVHALGIVDVMDDVRLEEERRFTLLFSLNDTTPMPLMVGSRGGCLVQSNVKELLSA
jgi:hypothetical protein